MFICFVILAVRQRDLIMNHRHLIFLAVPLLLAGCALAGPVHGAEEAADPVLSEWLDAYNYNYTRDTQMNFTAEAYAKVAYKDDGSTNQFPFTQTRKTLWTEEGLYMTNAAQAEGINAGYYSIKEDGVDELYRYTLKGDAPASNITSDDISLIDKNVKQGRQQACHEFFVCMHKFYKNTDWADKFTYKSDGGYFVSEDETVLEDFLAFCASCYTNPKIEEKPFLTFSEARIRKAAGDAKDLWLELHVIDDDKEKLDSDSGSLFASARVYAASETKIPILKAYLESLAA